MMRTTMKTPYAKSTVAAVAKLPSLTPEERAEILALAGSLLVFSEALFYRGRTICSTSCAGSSARAGRVVCDGP